MSYGFLGSVAGGVGGLPRSASLGQCTTRLAVAGLFVNSLCLCPSLEVFSPFPDDVDDWDIKPSPLPPSSTKSIVQVTPDSLWDQRLGSFSPHPFLSHVSRSYKFLVRALPQLLTCKESPHQALLLRNITQGGSFSVSLLWPIALCLHLSLPFPVRFWGLVSCTVHL